MTVLLAFPFMKSRNCSLNFFFRFNHYYFIFISFFRSLFLFKIWNQNFFLKSHNLVIYLRVIHCSTFETLVFACFCLLEGSCYVVSAQNSCLRIMYTWWYLLLKLFFCSLFNTPVWMIFVAKNMRKNWKTGKVMTWYYHVSKR